MNMQVQGIRRYRRHKLARAAALALRVSAHVIPEQLGQLPRVRSLRLSDARSRPRGAAARWRATSVAQRVALALLAVALVYRVALVLRGWPSLDSDEAITGLVARHILIFGERPAFFWGEHYMGALQSYLAAPFFAVLGSSTLALHLSVLVLVVGFLAGMYLLSRAAYGETVGLLVLAWLAVGPSIATLRELTSSGGYQDILFCGTMVLLGTWARLRRPERLPHGRREWRICLATYAAIGLCGGIGLWSDLLIIPVLVAAAVGLCAVRWREMAHGAALALLLGFIFGAFPYLYFNWTQPGSSYREAVMISGQGSATITLPTFDGLRTQVGETFAVALPTLFGSPHVCVNSGAIWHAYPTGQAHHTPHSEAVCDGANIAFSLILLGLYGVVALQLLRVARAYLTLALSWIQSLVARLSAARYRLNSRASAVHVLTGLPALLNVGTQRVISGIWGPEPEGEVNALATADAEATARLWLRAMLLATVALTLLAYVISVNAAVNEFTSVRYLVLLYLSAPLIFGTLWRYAAALVSALVARMRPLSAASVKAYRPLQTVRTPRRIAAATGLALLLAFSALGSTQTLGRAIDGAEFALPAQPEDQAVVAYLDAHHITHFYGDYWICYRLMFETNERLTCAVRGQNGDLGLQLINNRDLPSIQALAATRYPAYILPAGSLTDTHFVSEAKAERLPYLGYRREVVGRYAVYYHAP